MYDARSNTYNENTKRNAGRVGTVAGAVVGTVGSFATLATVGLVQQVWHIGYDVDGIGAIVAAQPLEHLH